MKYMKLGSKPDVFQTEGNNIRFVATELANDIIVNVGEVKFYLHKFPLLSKSSRLQKLVASTNEECNDEIDLPDIPGGPAAFEICAKFCYGMTVTLNAYNVVAALCAAEYLEMHEAIEKGNLIHKIEIFLNSSIFHSWKDSIIFLQATKPLLPWSEDLKVVSCCIDSIASKASINPSEVEWSYTYNRKKLPSENGLDPHWNGVRKQQTVPKDWWVEDLCELEMDLYKRIIMAIRNKGRISGEVIGEALKAYAYRRLSGFSKGSVTHGIDVGKSKTILETVVWLLPTVGSVSCSFLLKLLRVACLLDCGEVSKNELIKRIGYQLEEASVSDLLIPAAAGESTIYDIDVVSSIIGEFITARTSPQATGELLEVRSLAFVSGGSKLAVAKLVDGYLAEIAKDPNVPLSKFFELAEMVSFASRPVHDGLYRAIDMYLKGHPGLTKSEKRKICGLMDCKKLSVDACTHAVQNDRLPLRVVVQVLFQQLRATAAAPAAGNGTGGIAGSAVALRPEENCASNGSSRSAATTNTCDWGEVGDVSSLRSLSLAGRGGGSERSSGSGEVDKNGGEKGHGKVKGMLMPKRMLSKLWSGKGHGGESSSTSDTSESPGSVNLESAKTIPSGKAMRSAS